jgi:hypothetical protein
MAMCPKCLAELRPDPAAALEEAMSSGHSAYRATGVAPFSQGDAFTLRRLTADGALVYLSADVLIEAHVNEESDHYVCRDIEGPVLFTFRRVGDVWLAATAKGLPLAAFELRRDAGWRIDVRDEASAPCARLVPQGDGHYDLVETGGSRIGTCDKDVRVLDDDWQDEAWSVALLGGKAPLVGLAVAAIPLAVRVLVGHQGPSRRPAPPADVEGWPTS